jgi:hypothetical protein
VLQALEAEAQVAQRPEAQALEQQEKAEPLALPRRRQAQRELASEQPPGAQSQRAPRGRQVSELRPLVAVPPVLQRARSVVAQLETGQQPDAFGPPSQPLPSRLCPPWLSLRPRLLHPQRREGVCEPSRQHRPESSSSGSSFLERRTRAAGR